MKTTVIYHSADFDGLFCREIARKFLPDAELIGWDFGDPPISPSLIGETLYVMDLPLDRPFGLRVEDLIEDPAIKNTRIGNASNVIWIDHHASAIASHPSSVPGYRIDGVAACRLAWQWFTQPGFLQYNTDTSDEKQTVWAPSEPLPEKLDFINRSVSEPLAVRLAGEYDIWDKRNPDAELFQHGLRSCDLTILWPLLLILDQPIWGDKIPNPTVLGLLGRGRVLQYARAQEYRQVIQQQGFDTNFQGVRFLACNSHELDIRSQLFIDGIRDHHQALIGFTFTGSLWKFSLYHIPNHEHIDILSIAKKYGGGGHKGACGFTTETLPLLLLP